MTQYNRPTYSQFHIRNSTNQSPLVETADVEPMDMEGQLHIVLEKRGISDIFFVHVWWWK